MLLLKIYTSYKYTCNIYAYTRVCVWVCIYIYTHFYIYIYIYIYIPPLSYEPLKTVLKAGFLSVFKIALLNI